jgi:hypothetical protein
MFKIINLCNIQYKIVEGGSFEPRSLMVSYKTFLGIRLWENVKTLRTRCPDPYELDVPYFKNKTLGWSSPNVEFFDFMEKFNTTDKYLEYVKGLNIRYRNIETKYHEDLKYLKNKYNLK